MVSTARRPGERDRDAEYLWLVDPIDGTKAFVREYPMFSTQIALMHHGELIVGVSIAPVYGELAYAEKGSGAWLNGAADSCERYRAHRGRIGFQRNLKSLARGRQWSAFGGIVARADRIRGYGDFLHYHLLASGRIDAVLESDVNILDIAALAVIVEEAGGRFTDLDGKPVSIGIENVLATNGRLHAAAPCRARSADWRASSPRSSPRGCSKLGRQLIAIAAYFTFSRFAPAVPLHTLALRQQEQLCRTSRTKWAQSNPISRCGR